MSDWFSGRRSGALMPNLENLASEVSRVISDFGFTVPGQAAGGLTTAPRVDVVATDGGGYEIHAELPGVEEKDIDLSVDGAMLTLRGERRAEREEKGRSYRLRERSFGAFSRTIALPFEAKPDRIDAEFKNGVLTVRVERPREPERSGSKVNIRSSGGPSTVTAEASAGSAGGMGQSGGSGSAAGGGMMGEGASGAAGAGSGAGGMMGEG